MHPWFRGVDWTDLARLKAVFVPQVDDDTDTSYFEKKHVSAKVSAPIRLHHARLHLKPASCAPGRQPEAITLDTQLHVLTCSPCLHPAYPRSPWQRTWTW